MKALFGMIDLDIGQVYLDGIDITNLPPQERVLKGMGFVPQESISWKDFLNTRYGSIYK